MESFQSMFEKEKGGPITYKGKILIMSDFLKLPKEKTWLKITFNKFNSNLKQGLVIRALRKKKIKIFVNNQMIENAIVLWQDTTPTIVEMEIISKDKEIVIYNVWDYGDGVKHYWHNGGAMYTEEIPNGKKYYCNDGYPDDDFDDMIFTIEEKDSVT